MLLYIQLVPPPMPSKWLYCDAVPTDALPLWGNNIKHHPLFRRLATFAAVSSKCWRYVDKCKMQKSSQRRSTTSNIHVHPPTRDSKPVSPICGTILDRSFSSATATRRICCAAVAWMKSAKARQTQKCCQQHAVLPDTNVASSHVANKYKLQVNVKT